MDTTSDSTIFTGCWRCDRIDGDWDAFLCVAGLGWMSRQIAKTLGYGIGMRQIITMDGATVMKVTIKMAGPIPGNTQTILLDGSAQELPLADGSPATGTCMWRDDGSLVAIAVKRGGEAQGSEFTLTRSIVSGRMRLVLCVSGVTVSREFKREDAVLQSGPASGTPED